MDYNLALESEFCVHPFRALDIDGDTMDLRRWVGVSTDIPLMFSTRIHCESILTRG